MSTKKRPMGIAWGLTFVALAAAVGSYYKPGPIQLVSFGCVALAIVCLIVARRDELHDHRDQLIALRLEADAAMEAAMWWHQVAQMEAATIRDQRDAIVERDESAHEIVERWAGTIRPSTSARKAMAWMDDRSAYSTMAAAVFAERSGDEK